MKPIQRWLEVAMVSAFVMIVVYDYAQRQRFTPLILALLLAIVFYAWHWITGKRFTVKKSYPRFRLLLLTVGLILGLLVALGYVLLVNGGR